MDVDLLEPEAFVETMTSSFPVDNDPLARTIVWIAKSGELKGIQLTFEEVSMRSWLEASA
ncbi:MAG: hypothetical protein OXJ64_19490 [Boseongicola sp.]|nr:hypothetical protein [Boseongicola sp.]